MTTTTSTATLPKAGVYTIDPAHTEVGFIARHLIGTKVRGRFTEVVGHVHRGREPRGLDASRPPSRPPASTPTSRCGTTTCAPTTSSTSPTYPTLTLKSTGLKQVRRDHWILSTDLTIRGVTKPVDFDLEFLGEGPSMQEGKTVVAFSASADIDRRDFGVSFNHSLLDGSVVVGNKVVIEIEVEASQAD